MEQLDYTVESHKGFDGTGSAIEARRSGTGPLVFHPAFYTSFAAAASAFS